ncbi:hypothetical protein VTO42DRAFT_1014 [Malbranchea cinnamomea]
MDLILVIAAFSFFTVFSFWPAELFTFLNFLSLSSNVRQIIHRVRGLFELPGALAASTTENIPYESHGGADESPYPTVTVTSLIPPGLLSHYETLGPMRYDYHFEDGDDYSEWMLYPAFASIKQEFFRFQNLYTVILTALVISLRSILKGHRLQFQPQDVPRGANPNLVQEGARRQGTDDTGLSELEAKFTKLEQQVTQLSDLSTKIYRDIFEPMTTEFRTLRLSLTGFCQQMREQVAATLESEKTAVSLVAMKDDQLHPEIQRIGERVKLLESWKSNESSMQGLTASLEADVKAVRQDVLELCKGLATKAELNRMEADLKATADKLNEKPWDIQINTYDSHLHSLERSLVGVKTAADKSEIDKGLIQLHNLDNSYVELRNKYDNIHTLLSNLDTRVGNLEGLGMSEASLDELKRRVSETKAKVDARPWEESQTMLGSDVHKRLDSVTTNLEKDFVSASAHQILMSRVAKAERSIAESADLVRIASDSLDALREEKRKNDEEFHLELYDLKGKYEGVKAQCDVLDGTVKQFEAAFATKSKYAEPNESVRKTAESINRLDSAEEKTKENKRLEARLLENLTSEMQSKQDELPILSEDRIKGLRAEYEDCPLEVKDRTTAIESMAYATNINFKNLTGELERLKDTSKSALDKLEKNRKGTKKQASDTCTQVADLKVNLSRVQSIWDELRMELSDTRHDVARLDGRISALSLNPNVLNAPNSISASKPADNQIRSSVNVDTAKSTFISDPEDELSLDDQILKLVDETSSGSDILEGENIAKQRSPQEEKGMKEQPSRQPSEIQGRIAQQVARTDTKDSAPSMDKGTFARHGSLPSGTAKTDEEEAELSAVHRLPGLSKGNETQMSSKRENGGGELRLAASVSSNDLQDIALASTSSRSETDSKRDDLSVPDLTGGNKREPEEAKDDSVQVDTSKIPDNSSSKSTGPVSADPRKDQKAKESGLLAGGEENKNPSEQSKSDNNSAGKPSVTPDVIKEEQAEPVLLTKIDEHPEAGCASSEGEVSSKLPPKGIDKPDEQSKGPNVQGEDGERKILPKPDKDDTEALSSTPSTPNVPKEKSLETTSPKVKEGGIPKKAGLMASRWATSDTPQTRPNPASSTEKALDFASRSNKRGHGRKKEKDQGQSNVPVASTPTSETKPPTAPEEER